MKKLVTPLIILLLFTTVNFVNAESQIPDWVRNIFIWYGQGQISEDEVLNAIKFLIENSILQIDLTEITIKSKVGDEESVKTLPYSWIINGFEITLLGLYQVDMSKPFDTHGTITENHQEYEVHIKFKNLAKESVWLDKCIGFDEIKLQTDVDNIWDSRYGGGTTTCGSWDPQQELIKTAASVFSIYDTEIPKFLLVEINGESHIFEPLILNDSS